MKVESSTIQNKFLRVQTLNYGASLFEVYHKKKKINLILNLGSKENYRYKHPSVGSTCGRYAGRISNSKFKIGNKKFIFVLNNNICPINTPKTIKNIDEHVVLSHPIFKQIYKLGLSLLA